jgi:integral membrane protein
MKNPIQFLRMVALTEAVSFLLLLGIAMPLKYFVGLPMAVKLAGWLHGALFMVFSLALLQAMIIARWPLSRGALIFAAGLFPGGPFLVDRRLHVYDAELRQRQVTGSARLAAREGPTS